MAELQAAPNPPEHLEEEPSETYVDCLRASAKDGWRAYERLRAALEEIADFEWGGPIRPVENPTTQRMREIARDALEGL